MRLLEEVVAAVPSLALGFGEYLRAECTMNELLLLRGLQCFISTIWDLEEVC